MRRWRDLQTEWTPSTFEWREVILPPGQDGWCACVGATTLEMAIVGLCRCKWEQLHGRLVLERILIR